MSRKVEIVEVGPRDGLQNERTTLTPAQRVEFIRRLEAAGARRIEAVSFVNPARVPQMAGAEEIMDALHADGGAAPAGRSLIGLVLNMRGWERAVSTGCDEANVVVCASDGFGLRNQGTTSAQQREALLAIAERRAAEGGPPLSVTIAVAFGCPFDGETPLARVVEIAAEAARAGVAEVALGDTIGVADPWAVRRAVEQVGAAIGDARLRLHFHDTRHAGLANAYAAVEAGARVLDSSCGGIGGCPFAPAATGNVATEDLVYMLDRAGVETGLDLGRLIETADWIGDLLSRPHPSALSRAGGFPA